MLAAVLAVALVGAGFPGLTKVEGPGLSRVEGPGLSGVEGSRPVHPVGAGFSWPAHGAQPRDAPTLQAILAIEDARAPTASDLAVLLQGAASSHELIQRNAIRALGRLERRDVVPNLLPYLRSPSPLIRIEAAFAVAQAMRGEPLASDAAGSQVESVLSVLLATAAAEAKPNVLAELARSVARLPFERPEQLGRADRLLQQILTLSRELSLVRDKEGDAKRVFAGGVAGAELLARLHSKIAPPTDELIAILRRHVMRQVPGVPVVEAPATSTTFQALAAARGVDEETLMFALQSLDPHARRLAVLTLAGGGSPITGPERANYLRKAMDDKEFFVRYEAVRGYARSHAKSDGCAQLLTMLTDRNPHVALAAIDAVGDACRGDENAVLRTVAEARTPPTRGSWHREAHAMVALAKLSPSHAEIPLLAHSRHTTWQVRMYAARAAAALNDVATLERLANDPNDNVREATLAALKRLKGDAAEPYFVAALARRDYQLLLTAANESKGLVPTEARTFALTESLKRVTAEQKETSRDTRLALVERLREIGGDEVRTTLARLLTDFDPKVAASAAEALTALTGTAHVADPRPLPLPSLPSASEMAILENQVAVLVMETGRNIELDLDPGVAPLTAVRFLRLSKADYFNGLTFHRVVPNFVVQGGSPGANEYAGDGPYLRDEIGNGSHWAGTVGLSTRGRDTGDAQLFINLVHNPRLDFQYTIFGRISGGSVWDILEGDVITDVRWIAKK